MISRAIKRWIDVLGSLTGLILAAPLFPVIGMMIRLTMGPGVIFAQDRAGLHGRPFRLIKFRTMTNDRGPTGSLLPDDRRLTRLGAFFRKTSLDELPQFWNVLKGDMSLIGPRPLPVEYLKLYTPEQMRRQSVRPGLVSLATVRGRNKNTWEEKFAYDLYYVDNRSLWLDLFILALAVPTILSCSGVNEQGRTGSSDFTGTKPKADGR
ncbi:MAG: sugar transferase [Pseudomonadota bacterium]